MPMRPRRACNAAGCPKLTSDRYCQEHKRQEQRRYDSRRGSSSERGYDTTWQRLRAAYLRSHPLCNRCPGVVPAIVVHHKQPISDGGERLDTENLEALCETCHNKHHGFG